MSLSPDCIPFFTGDRPSSPATTPMLLMSTSRRRVLFAQTLNLLRDRLFVELEPMPVVGLHKALDATRFL